MTLSDGNWCKYIYVLCTFLHITANIGNYFLKSHIPTLAVIVRYGKLVDTTTTQSLTLPKSYFKHFYIVAAFVYVPIVLYQVWLVYYWGQPPSKWFMTFLNICCGSERRATTSATHTWMAIILLTLQIWRRFYDTHFVSVFSKKASIHILHYSLGLVFYMGIMLIVLSEAPKFTPNTGNFRNEDDETDLIPFTKIDIFAVVLFFWAWYHQHTTTVILANLRKNKKGEVISENYKIPEGDWFKYLSSPHCVAEILIYTSIWLLLGIRHSWWCVYLMVFYNQMDSIVNSHLWYREHFKDFPRKRKALFPFII